MDGFYFEIVSPMNSMRLSLDSEIPIITSHNTTNAGLIKPNLRIDTGENNLACLAL